MQWECNLSARKDGHQRLCFTHDPVHCSNSSSSSDSSSSGGGKRGCASILLCECVLILLVAFDDLLYFTLLAVIQSQPRLAHSYFIHYLSSVHQFLQPSLPISLFPSSFIRSPVLPRLHRPSLPPSCPVPRCLEDGQEPPLLAPLLGMVVVRPGRHGRR